ncbi:MAG: hypothetical protein JOZ54_05830 [Acidobacteria bacterium]|nr:hypothetical protein [Acidobacteriota bacterium]
MTTPPGPILGAEAAPKPQPPTAGPAPELPIAKELPPWDLLPSDLLLVRRRPGKK